MAARNAIRQDGLSVDFFDQGYRQLDRPRKLADAVMNRMDAQKLPLEFDRRFEEYLTECDHGLLLTLAIMGQFAEGRQAEVAGDLTKHPETGLPSDWGQWVDVQRHPNRFNWPVSSTNLGKGYAISVVSRGMTIVTSGVKGEISTALPCGIDDLLVRPYPKADRPADVGYSPMVPVLDKRDSGMINLFTEIVRLYRTPISTFADNQVGSELAAFLHFGEDQAFSRLKELFPAITKSKYDLWSHVFNFGCDIMVDGDEALLQRQLMARLYANRIKQVALEYFSGKFEWTRPQRRPVSKKREVFQYSLLENGSGVSCDDVHRDMTQSPGTLKIPFFLHMQPKIELIRLLCAFDWAQSLERLAVDFADYGVNCLNPADVPNLARGPGSRPQSRLLPIRIRS